MNNRPERESQRRISLPKRGLVQLSRESWILLKFIFATLIAWSVGFAEEKSQNHKVVESIVIAPDGSEVWCVAGVNSGPTRAFVFRTATRQWHVVPEDRSQEFISVAFSSDAQQSWMAVFGNEGVSVFQRRDNQIRWSPIQAKIPRRLLGWPKIWVRPNHPEIWLNDTDGLLRIKLETGTVSRYSSNGRFGIRKPFTILGNGVFDLLFNPDGTTVTCVATGRGNGLSLIDLNSGQTTNFPVSEKIVFERLVLGRDGRTVWCIGNNSDLWAFDVKSQRWIQKFSEDKNFASGAVDGVRTVLRFSKDGDFIWLRGRGYLGVYNTKKGKWHGCEVDLRQFESHEFDTKSYEMPLEISENGQLVLTSNDCGLAIYSIHGYFCRALKPHGIDGPTYVSRILPITGDCYACTFIHKRGCSLYQFNLGKNKFRHLLTVEKPITALKVADTGSVWVAVPGIVREIAIDTGRLIHEYHLTD